MPIVYYVQPGATAENDEPTNPPLGPPMVAVPFATYDAARAAITRRILTELLWSPSKRRVPASPLAELYLSPPAPIAIFVEDFGPGVTQVKFKLDAVLVNTEASAPWDYFGTDGMGFSNRGTFLAGLHTVTADITDSVGTFTVTAAFEVE